MNSSDDTAQSMTIDCVDYWIDEPGDTTVRPIPPERLERAKALRELILAAEAEAAKKPANS